MIQVHRLLAVLALSGVIALPVPVNVAGGAAATSEFPSASPAAFSAVRKKLRVRSAGPAPARYYGWRPADPSFDQYGRLYRPPPGLPCPIDLGYGRWTSCSNR
jgi:hypothetical protein